jgi:hypothetical protein
MRLTVIEDNIATPKGRARHVQDSLTGQRYILSDVGFETLAFPCDEDGQVTDWGEVAGEMHGGQSLDEVQAELEDRLASGTANSDLLMEEKIEQHGVTGLFGRLFDDIERFS